ncbi:MAG: hypothetical protein JST53_18015, partial [Actinobacteria bacterium]|nr:hypothetical protein [Actinomycetota bacterium]
AGSAIAGQAPRWKVNEAFLGNGAEESIEAVSSTEVLLRLPKVVAWNITSSAGNCRFSGTIVGSVAETPGTGKGGVLTCHGLEVEEAPPCTVNGTGTLTTHALSSRLVWLAGTGQKAGIKMQPETGAELAKFEITGAECSLAGIYSMSGELIAELQPEATNAFEGETRLPALPRASCTTPNRITTYWSNATTRVSQSLSAPLMIGANPATTCGTYKTFIPGKTQKWGVFAG